MSSGNSAKARFDAVSTVSARSPRKFDPPRDEQGRRLRVSDFYGINTFDLNKMKDKLPKEVYTKLVSTIQAGGKLDREISNTVANAMKEWALARGVTHFCHWFQPLTGSTAEKHDAFISLDDNRPMEKFSGGSSFRVNPMLLAFLRAE